MNTLLLDSICLKEQTTTYLFFSTFYQDAMQINQANYAIFILYRFRPVVYNNTYLFDMKNKLNQSYVDSGLFMCKYLANTDFSFAINYRCLQQRYFGKINHFAHNIYMMVTLSFC